MKLNRVIRDFGLAAVVASALFAIWPFFRPGLPGVADAPIHMLRAAEFGRVLAEGIYPRWAPNLAFGYGYPLFIFAPPLPYIVILAFHYLGLSLEAATKAMAAGSLLMAGVGMYLFVREVMGAGPGIVAALAYVYAPFQLREAYIYGGNYPQLLAIALFPFILWAFCRLVVSGRLRYVPLGALFYGGLILSHNFHALAFTPFLGLYVLLLLAIKGGWKERRKVAMAGGTGALALGWTAFFWLPAIYEREWCKAHEEFYIGRSDFRLRFLDLHELFALPRPLDRAVADPYMPFSLGLAAIALAGITLLLFALIWSLPGEKKAHMAFFFIMLAGTVFMLLPISTPVWEKVPFLATAEFPWRLMGLATLCIAFLAGASLYPLWEKVPGTFGGAWHLALLGGSVLLVLLCSAVYLYPPQDFVPYGTPSLAEAVRFELETQTIGSTTLGEYLPIWVEEVPTTSPMAADYLAGRPIDRLDREALPPYVNAEELAHTATSDGYLFRSEEPFTARFHAFYFPGWQAYIDGRPAEIEIVRPRGTIAVSIPAGEHEFWLRFGNTPVRTASEIISLLAGLAMLALMAVSLLKQVPGTSEVPGTSGTYQALTLAGILLALLAIKVAFVDSHTTWFRQHSPPGRVICVEHPAYVNFGDEILFLGYDLIGGDKVRPGGELRVRLYWQALRPLEKDYRTFLHLDARPDFNTWASSDSFHPGDPRAQIDIPTSTWRPETYVRDEHRLLIPPDILPVEYFLRIGIYDRNTHKRLPVLSAEGQAVSDAFALGTVHVISERPARPRYEEKFTLGGKIELLGYDLIAGENGALEVKLYWRAREKIGEDYKVFVHILDEEGAIKQQRDTAPVEGMYPTSSWLAGGAIEDTYRFTLPPGRYRLAIGMYDPESLERLKAVDSSCQSLPEDLIILSHRVEMR